jgi:hypothetical protein
VRYLLPDAVLQYIYDHRMYCTDPHRRPRWLAPSAQVDDGAD